MNYKDYYKILGVDKTASLDEIKKRYRLLARKYHPDVSKEKNAEEKFKEVQEAYTVLKDPEKRKAYDQMGQYQSAQGFQPPPNWGENVHFEFGGGEGFSDFFENLFGQQARSRRGNFKQRGADQQAKLPISLEEAYHGGVKSFSIEGKQLKVKIPAGITEGQQIRLAGQGGLGMNGGASGDLYLEIILLPHPLYAVERKDIMLSLPITPWEAALGAAIEVPTLGGKIKLKISTNSQTGQKLRLKGRGLPGKIPGDQYVLLKICTPEAKTEKQKSFYKEMAKEMPFNPREKM